MTDDGTDRQTDGRAIAYTRYSIYAVARKKTRGTVSRASGSAHGRDSAVNKVIFMKLASPQRHRIVMQPQRYLDIIVQL